MNASRYECNRVLTRDLVMQEMQSTLSVTWSTLTWDNKGHEATFAIVLLPEKTKE